MVAGGVQSVEEGALYATHPSYYPQFYSTLLPPAPPGSYSSSNYSSSTYSSSGQSSDCSWLRPEGVEGVFVPSPSGRARHPRCTCPSPEAVRQARKALAARRVRASRDPRCTCPSPPPGSRDASPWSGTSPSPPSTPATASPPPRHPRCTCPDPETSSLRLKGNRRTKSARDLRCTCPSTPTPPPSKEPECTCPPHLRPQQCQSKLQQQQPTRSSSKGRLVHAVLLNYPGSTAISTDHGDFVKLSDSPGKITEPDVVMKVKAKKSKPKGKSKDDEKSEDEDTTSVDASDVGCVGGSDDTVTPPSSPAQRVKNKLCHLRHKMVSGVAALAISRGQKDQETHTCSCEKEGGGGPMRPRVRAPGVVTRILPPPPSPAADESSQDEEKAKVDSSISSDQESSFPVEELPQPILEDVCSPLGDVPPLSPPKLPFTPNIRENFFQHPLTRHLFEIGSNANLASPSITPTKDTTTLSFSRSNELRVVNPNLRQLQKLSISHGQLDEDMASVIRTRSMELYVKDITEQNAKLPNQQRLGGSVSHIAAAAVAAASRTEKPQISRRVLPHSANRMKLGNGGLQFSTPCLSSGTLTCFSTTQNTLRVSDDIPIDRAKSRQRKHPDYENVAFHNSGEYVMLSKKLLDQWQLSYDACLPPEGSLVVTDSEGVTTLRSDVLSVNIAENGQVSTGPALQKKDSERVALPPCPSTAVPLPVHSSVGNVSSSVDHISLTVLPPSSVTSHPQSPIGTSASSLPPLSISQPYFAPYSMYPSSLSTPPPSTPPLTSFTAVPSSLPLPLPPSSSILDQLASYDAGSLSDKQKHTVSLPRSSHEDLSGRLPQFHSLRRDSLKIVKKEDLWVPRSSIQNEVRSFRRRRASDTAATHLRRGSSSSISQMEQTGEWRRRPLHAPQDDGDTDQETDRLLGQQRSDDPGFYDEKGWRRPKTRTVLPRATNHKANGGGATSNGSTPTTPISQSHQVPTNQTPSSPPDMATSNKNKNKKEKEANKKKGRSKEVMIHEPAVLIEGVLFRARYLGSTQLVSEGQPTKTTRMMQAEEAVSRIKDADDDKEALRESHELAPSPGSPYSPSPNHSPISQSPPGGQIYGESNSPREYVMSRGISPKEQICSRNSDSPKSKVCRSLSSPRSQENFHVSPRIVHSPRRGHRFPQSPPEIRHSGNTTVWKPVPKMATGIPNCSACSYMTDVSTSHSVVAPLPLGVLEEPIESENTALLSVSEKREPVSITVGEEEFEGAAEMEDEDEEVEGDETNEVEVEEEEDEEDEEEEEDDEDADETDKIKLQGVHISEDVDRGEVDENLSSDSEDQCIEVLTVIPGASAATLEETDDGLDVNDDDGGGGSLEWVSEESGGPGLGPAGTVFHLRLVGSVDVAEESGKASARKTTFKRPKKDMVMEAVAHLKAPDGETQPSTEVDLFISTEKIMVLNTDLKEIMMDHALRTISYIADIGDLVVLMARRRVLPTDDTGNNIQKTPKMICHVFESDEAQFIAQSIGQAFQVAYLEFLKANGIEDHSFVKEMDYQEVLNSQEIFGDELQMFAKKELQKEVVVPKMKSEILGVVVVESGWGSMVPTVVIANLSPTGAAAKCGQLNIGDQIIAINGVSLVGLPLSTCQNYIKNTKYNTAVKLTVVPCPPVVEVKIRRPDTKYQLGFSVQNGVICSLLRGGIAERGGVRVGHRIIDINSQSVVAVPHEKIVNLLATSVGEIRMKTMPTSIFRLLTGQETPQYI